MGTQKVAAIQEKIVRCFAQDIREQWDFVLVDFERMETEDQWITDIHEVFLQREGGAWKQVSVIAPIDGEKLLKELAQAMSADGKQPWTTCTLELESSGKYRFSFSFDPPKRLNGDLDYDAFQNYSPKPL